MAIQLQEFAKQVLYGTTLEEKLSFPRDEIIDTVPGNAIKTPPSLSRPAHLKLREDGIKASHPSAAKLIDEKERGRLLHFFGNHELLATELMALVLLKFPDAPASFRKGVLDTLKEEQIHTQMYIHRMKQCGVEFGELPLTDYFWKSVSSMEDPLDYVTRLSLTFEQANLDYSREYKKHFQNVGDTATASILDKIYRDEIDHVGFGLKWFRKWKANNKTDWEAFSERLIFPLSPARAKGNHFNSEGRRKTGLDDSFINNLELFSKSRGRTPNVFWFNPDSERFAAQNSSDDFQWGSSKLQNDLEFLPAFLSRKDDVIILRQKPSTAFLKQLQDIGFELPEILLPSTPTEAPSINRKVNELRPWAWTPESISFLGGNFQRASRIPSKDTLWNNTVQQIHSKAWSSHFAKILVVESADTDWLAPANTYGIEVRSLGKIVDLRAYFQSEGYTNIVCKAPFGTAANGNRCLLEGESISQSLEAWITKNLETQKSLIVEPWLDRVFDFSIQFEAKSNGLKTVAYTRLINNHRGQFRGILANGFTKDIDSEIARFLMSPLNGKARIYNWVDKTLKPALNSALQNINFTGPLGIDAFVYRDSKGRLKLKPLVELNPRYTMGRLAHELAEKTAPGALGFFEIINRTQLKKSNSSNFVDFAQKIKEENPILLKENPTARIARGSFPLNDPTSAKSFLAFYHVGKMSAHSALR
ncbi:ferritin-like domain-containing protein [Puniceicoccaceae bacterium K14]|nr:ferritin-like domain-containing protein [Puniceicoccaceae bacterium K14]